MPRQSTLQKTKESKLLNTQQDLQKHNDIQQFSVFKERYGDMSNIASFSPEKMIAYGNCIYTALYSGLGSQVFVRNLNGKILALFMHQDDWGQYGPKLDKTPLLKKFIEGFEEINHDNFSL